MIVPFVAVLLASALDSAAPAAAATLPETALPDGTYRYAFRSGSTDLGASVITIRRSPTGVTIHEAASLSNRTYTLDQTIDAGNAVLSKFEAVYPGALPTGIHATFAGGSWSETVDGVPGTKLLTAPKGTSGAIVLDGPVMSGFFLLPAQSRVLGATSLLGISPGSELPFSLSLTRADSSSRPKSVPAADPGWDVNGLQSGVVSIWFDPATLVPADFEVASQGISIVLTGTSTQAVSAPTPPPAPTPLPTPAPHFASRDIAFVSADGTSLAGTLTTPDKTSGPVPAVVLVQGSGAVDRDERVGPNPIFLELSNALSNHGFVVLRYDKRGIGKSGGNASTMTRGQLLADARAAIAFLAATPHVDAGRVFMLGHSEGGELAPSLAASGARLRGIALMAPPALPLEQILMQQATRGLTGTELRTAAADERAAIAKIRTGASTAPGATWLRSSFGIDPAAVIRDVPCPILILQGGKDFQVLAHDLPRLVDAAKAAHRDVTVRVFPDDDHLFTTVPGSQAATVGEYLVPHAIDPAMVSALIAWLDEKARR